MDTRARQPAAIARRARAHPSRGFDELEGRTLLAADPVPSAALGRAVEIVGPADQVASQVSVSAPLIYRIDPTEPSRLVAEAQAWGPQIRLTLLDQGGRTLVQSDGQSGADPLPRIDQHVPAGTYYFEVESLGGSGVASLTVTTAAASDPFGPIPVGAAATSLAATGDFNGDGHLDLVSSDGVHLGSGDGTFLPATPGTALTDLPGVDGNPAAPAAVVVGDFNGDGKPDLAVADSADGVVQILLGVGDGTFRAPIAVPVGDAPDALAAGDFDGDGHLDLAVANGGDGTVTILKGLGDGSFRTVEVDPVGQLPDAMVAGDFDGDGHLDLAVADTGSDDVTLLMGRGDGSFGAGSVTPVGPFPTSLVSGDFDGDGRLDLAVTDADPFNVVGTGDLRILENDGRGGFRAGATVAPGVIPVAVAAGDLNGDGVPDLVVANFNSNTVAVLLGGPGGQFRVTGSVPAGHGPDAPVLGDFNGDGRVDLAVASSDSQDLGVFLGDGDGTFRSPTSPQAGAGPTALATGDFDGDGRPDMAVVDGDSNQVTILLGSGDGAFRTAQTVPVGQAPIGIVAGDFNGDGVTDLAVADYGLTGPGDVTILLGNGDGTFRALAPIAAGVNPRNLVSADFNGDGVPDLAVSDAGSDAVSILLGRGDGTFATPVSVPVGADPRGLVAGDFDGDGHLDLAVADFGSNAVTILHGLGDGGFVVGATVAVGLHPYGLAAGDFEGDGHLDLAVTESGYSDLDPDPSAETGGNAVTILHGTGNGSFRIAGAYAAGLRPTDVLAGDFNGDGRPDLAVANALSSTVSILINEGAGVFGVGETLAVGAVPVGLASTDLDGDGHADLAVAVEEPSQLAVRLGLGNGQFVDPGPNPLSTQHTPVLADLTGDGAADLAVIDGTGEILFRKGRVGQPGSFDPPLVADPGSRSRDIVAVTTSQGVLLASVQADSDEVVLLKYDGQGFARVGTLVTGSRPSRIVSADLNGDGLPDLLVLDHDGGTLTLFLGNVRGGFGPRVALAAEPGPADPNGLADLALADVDGDGRPDILVADRISGAVDVIRNLGGGAFAPPVTYRAGAGPYGIGGLAGVAGVSTLEGTAAVVAARFTPGGPADLVAADGGSNTLGRLAALGGGRFANPIAGATPSPAWAVVAADLDGDGRDEVITLGAGGLQVYQDDGRGGLVLDYQIADVGDEPEGLAVADVDGDGRPDVLVGSAFGDVLVLRPDASGRLRDAGPLDNRVGIAVTSQRGPGGLAGFAVVVPGSDLVIAGQGAGGSVVGDRASGVDSPSAVQLVDLDGDGIPDLVVANGGGNDVLVYPGLGGGRYGPALGDGRGFAVGTDPVAIAVADVDGDGRPDLVVTDRGSNDVAILLNRQSPDGGLTFRPGPRLKVGAGPSATLVADLDGNGLPDLVVTNSGSNNVYILHGRGLGSFDAVNPTILPVAGTGPGAEVIGNFTGRARGLDLVTLDQGSNSLSFFAGINGGTPVAQSIPSGGQFPIAALALDRGDGASNLLVANNGDGTLALFEWGLGGLSLASAFQPPELPHPTALALGADGLIFAGTEASDAAIRVSLGLGLGANPVFSAGLPSAAGSLLTATAGADATIALLQPPGELSLALVATLLSAASEAPASSANGGALPNQSLLGKTSGVTVGEADPDAADDSEAPGPDAAGASPLERLVAGIDEAFARARDEARLAAGAPARMRAIDALLDRWGPTIRVLGGPSPGIVRGGLHAIDAALRALGSAPRAADSSGRPGASTSGAVPLGVASVMLAAVARPLADRVRRARRN